MFINKFVATPIRLVGFNLFIADLLESVISTACEDEENGSPLLALMEIHLSENYYYLDEYINIPDSENADQLITKYESDAFNTIYKILKDQPDLIDLLCDCYKNNTPTQILGMPQGIWVEIHG